MPNWCSNWLEVHGDKESLEKFYSDVSGDSLEPTLSFDALVPLPEDQKDNWYEWHIANWGTKWDVSHDVEVSSTPEDGELGYAFSSAWGPPDEWIHTIAKRYNNLDFKIIFEEGGVGFAGIIEYSQGECIEEAIYSFGEEGYREFCEEEFGPDFFDWMDEDEN